MIDFISSINVPNLNILLTTTPSRSRQSSLHPLIFLLGATYDSIEGRFRIIKREAAVLRAEIEQGERPQAPPRGSAATKPTPAASTAASSFVSVGFPDEKLSVPRKPRTPKKTVIKHENGDRVLTGRVGRNNRSPKKTADAAMVVKTEPMTGEDSFLGGGQEIDLQTDAAHDAFMEALDKDDFDDILRYEGGMGIWIPSGGEKGRTVLFKALYLSRRDKFPSFRSVISKKREAIKSTWCTTTAYVPALSFLLFCIQQSVNRTLRHHSIHQ